MDMHSKMQFMVQHSTSLAAQAMPPIYSKTAITQAGPLAFLVKTTLFLKFGVFSKNELQTYDEMICFQKH